MFQFQHHIAHYLLFYWYLIFLSVQFMCPKCYRFYTHKRSLLRHMRYECQKAPMFKCCFEGCSYKAHQKATLLRHGYNKHGLTTTDDTTVLEIPAVDYMGNYWNISLKYLLTWFDKMVQHWDLCMWNTH